MKHLINMIKHVISNRWVLVICRLVVGGTFIIAGGGKVLAPFLFADSMMAYNILPEFLLLPVGLFIIWEELICGVFLLLGLFTRAAAVIASGMLLVFIVALVSAIVRGFDIDCGCFGKYLPANVGLSTLARSCALFLFSFLIFRHGPGTLGIDKSIDKNT